MLSLIVFYKAKQMVYYMIDMKLFYSIALICLVISVSGQNGIKITSDFPGGNIVVNKTGQDTIWLKPDLSNTRGNWFYWYFKAANISGKEVTFIFEQDNVFAKYGPAYSLNNDRTWKWYGENRIINNGFSFSFSTMDTVAYFCFAFPYTEDNLYEFISKLKLKDQLKIDTFCLSSEKRIVERISITPSDNEPTYKVLIVARHHACEMMANFVLEGMMVSILSLKDMQFLRDHVEFCIIPFVDKDGVENGEQGKNRIPHDHNRDYSGNSIYNSVSVLRNQIPAWSEKKLEIVLDLHCPWVTGELHECITLLGSDNTEMEKSQLLFSKILQKNSLGDIRYSHSSFLFFGSGWNSNVSVSKGMKFSKWASMLEGVSLSTTLEFPYANVSGMPVSMDGARIFGQAMAYSIMDYLKTDFTVNQ